MTSLQTDIENSNLCVSQGKKKEDWGRLCLPIKIEAAHCQCNAMLANYFLERYLIFYCPITPMEGRERNKCGGKVNPLVGIAEATIPGLPGSSEVIFSCSLLLTGMPRRKTCRPQIWFSVVLFSRCNDVSKQDKSAQVNVRIQVWSLWVSLAFPFRPAKKSSTTEIGLWDTPEPSPGQD